MASTASPAASSSTSAAPVQERTKRKRNRKALNCAVCRKLKIKCDRKIPCEACVKRGHGSTCPDEPSKDFEALLEERNRLQDRLKELETERRDTQPSTVGYLSMAEATSTNETAVTAWTSDAQQLWSFSGEPFRAGAASPGRACVNASYPDIEPQDQYASGPTGHHLPELHPFPNLTTDIPYCTPASHLALPMLGFSTCEAPVSITIADAIQHLPEYEEAEIKMSWYLKSIAWYCAPMSVEDTVKLVNEVYQIRETGQLDVLDIDQEYHKVAVVFIILALGTLMDMELQPHSPEAKQYCSIAQHCLGSGHHVTRHTPYALQALSLMAKFVVHCDTPAYSEIAHQLRSQAVKMAIAMNLNREVSLAKLPPREQERRRWGDSFANLSRATRTEYVRRTFWDIHSGDVYTCRNWVRPNCLSSEQFDTRLPLVFGASGGETAEAFWRERCRLSNSVQSFLKETLRIHPSPFTEVVQLWQQVAEMEAEMPYDLRCQAAWSSLISRYASMPGTKTSAPSPSRKDLILTFQQHGMAAEYALATFALLRPYFVHSIYSWPDEPLISPYAAGFLAVVEKCRVRHILASLLECEAKAHAQIILAITASLHSLFPSSSMRQWHYWSNIFPTAICLCAIVVRSPRCIIAQWALQQLDLAIQLLQSATQVIPRISWSRSMSWLSRFREQGQAGIAAVRQSRDSAAMKDIAIAPAFRDWAIKLTETGRHKASTPSNQQGDGEWERYIWRAILDDVKLGGDLGITSDFQGSLPTFDPNSLDPLQQLLNIPINHPPPPEISESVMRSSFQFS